MQFTFDITIEPNTLKSEVKRKISKLCYGTLKKVSIYFPWGCAGYAGIRIIHYEHQLYPTNPDQWFTGNEILIEFDCEYDILQGWNDFKIEGYNEDEEYLHTPIISFVVLPIIGMYPPRETWVEG